MMILLGEHRLNPEQEEQKPLAQSSVSDAFGGVSYGLGIVGRERLIPLNAAFPRPEHDAEHSPSSLGRKCRFRITQMPVSYHKKVA